VCYMQENSMQSPLISEKGRTYLYQVFKRENQVRQVVRLFGLDQILLHPGLLP